MKVKYILLDISSNLNRIANFYIKGNLNFQYFVEESLKLISSIGDQVDIRLLNLIENTIKSLDKLKLSIVDKYIIDDISTYSVLLSNYAMTLD